MWIHSEHSNTHKIPRSGKIQCFENMGLFCLNRKHILTIFPQLNQLYSLCKHEPRKEWTTKNAPSDWKFASRQINPQYDISFKLTSLIFSTSSWDKRVLLLLPPALSYGWAIFLRNWTERQTIINLHNHIVYDKHATYILY